MRIFIMALLLTMAVGTAEAITLGEAQTEAHDWVVVRQSAILNRVTTCISEGNPRLCHTAWAASVTPNTAPADSALATVTLDDPGRLVTGPCDSCYTGEGQFADAGIAIPATAPLNAKINIFKSNAGWGQQVVIRIRYDGAVYERGYAIGAASGFGWRIVE